MTTMIAEVYDALLEAGASEEKARKAAEAVAQYEERFYRLETRMVALEGRMQRLEWMVGTNIALTFVGMSIVVGLLLNVAKLFGR